MKKRNLIYTGLLMLSLVTTPVYAQDKRVEVTNGICMLEEGSASIVIQAHDKQPMNGKTFRMYKLFDAENSSDNASTSYALNPVYAYKIKQIVSTKLNRSVDDQDVLDYMRSLNNSNNQREYRHFIEQVQNAIMNLDSYIIHVESTDVNGNIVIDKLAYGFYLIDEVTNVINTHGASSLTMVNTASPKVVMQIKSDYPSVEKKVYEDDNSIGWNDMGDFEINQDIPFKYVSKLPDMSGNKTYFFEFEDEMDPCLSLRADSVRLKIKDQFVVQNKYTYTATDRGFKITFTDLKQIPNINKGDSIVLSYTAYLNESAVPKISKRGFENKVRVNFSNDPQNESKGQSPWDCVVCYTYQLNGLKSNEKNVKLKGATFKMYRDAAMRDQVKMKKTDSGYVVTDGQSEDIVSNENGEFYIKDGKVDFDYSGTINQSDCIYTVKSGWVVSKEGISGIIKGVDVSHHNNDNGEGVLNWAEVANAGYKFAMVKVAGRSIGDDGSLYTDKYYEENIKGALSNGLQLGVYFFSQAMSVDEAIEEANYICDLIAGYNISYPVVFDWETTSGYRTQDLRSNSELRTAMSVAFCDTVKNRGYDPMIYINKFDYLNYVDTEKLSSSYDIWLAWYCNDYDETGKVWQEGDKVPNIGYNYRMWQYSSTAGVPGIAGGCDVNIAYGTR